MKSPAEVRAEFVYEACRLEAIASRRPIVPEPFHDRDKAFKANMVSTVERICTNPDTTPEREHESWVRAYETMGWRYGPVRDPGAKIHPDMVPFAELPVKEQEKDAVFLALCAIAREFIHD